MGHSKRATEDFVQAILLNPQDARAYVNRAILNLEAKRRVEAIKDLRTALELEPSDAHTWQMLKDLGVDPKHK